MIKPRLTFLTVSLVTAIGLSSCAPAVTTVPATAAVAPILATATPADLPAAPEATASAPAQPAEVQAIATSRGPNLEATDPATVSLVSDQLQLVEFFRFT